MKQLLRIAILATLLSVTGSSAFAGASANEGYAEIVAIDPGNHLLTMLGEDFVVTRETVIEDEQGRALRFDELEAREPHRAGEVPKVGTGDIVRFVVSRIRPEPRAPRSLVRVQRVGEMPE